MLKKKYACNQCGKIAVSGNNRSHAMNATKREFRPNLAKKIIAGEKVFICAKCLRTLNQAV